MDAASTGPLETEAAAAIVQHVWVQFRPFVLIDLGCVFLSALLLVRATASIRSGSSVQWLLLLFLGILVVKTTFEEAFEMVSKGVKACRSYILDSRHAKIFTKPTRDDRGYRANL